MNADDKEDDEFTSSSDSGSEDEFEERGNPEDEDVEDINSHSKETSTIGRGSMSHHATHAHPDGRYSSHYTHGWSHVGRPYPTYALGPSSSHYTTSSPLGHPYPHQHGTPSPPVHALPAKHGTIPSSSHHSTPSPPADVYLHDHSIKSFLSHHTTPSPSVHPAHSPRVDDEHTSTSRRPPAPHRHSSARSSSIRLHSSIPRAIEEIPYFFRPPTAPAEGENPLIYLIAEHDMLHHSFVAAGKMSLVFKSGYLKEGLKWEYVPQSQRDIYWLRWKVFFTWDLQMSFAIYDAWCRKAAIWYMGNIYLIAKKRITPIYLTDEVFKHYKRMRATDEAFKKKSEQMSTNRKSEVGGPTLVFRCIALEVYLLDIVVTSWKRSFNVVPHGRRCFNTSTPMAMTTKLSSIRDLRKLILEEMSTQTPDTSIDEDVVYLEVVPEVKGRVYGLGSQGYHRSISLGEASSSRGPVYGPHELEKLQQDHQRLQEILLKERMEKQEQMQKDKMEHQEENREMHDRLSLTERSGPQSDDQPGHLTTDITYSQSAHLDDHQPGHRTNPCRRMSEDQRHLLDDHDEYVHRWHLILVLLIEKELTRLLCFCWLKALGINNILGFDWLASPAPEAMIRALEVLYALGVLDEVAKLTSPIGFQVLDIPLDLDGKRSPS
ncbi:hypothetical protein Syun_023560 [Stephania yunnanensis]|uniref:Uncharacterized protein n=1 Tax=Stephania yunnanensis TaxID=152371 RepID=A0AAP0I3U7_9MAGN